MSDIVARTRWRDAFAIPEFRGLYAASTISIVGDQLAKIAVAILVFSWSGSALLASLTFAASLLPALIAGPLLGHLADTRRRRELMIVCDLARAVLVAALLLPGLPVLALIGILFVASIFDTPFNAARSALLPDVLDGELYAVGQSINGVTGQAGQVIGFGFGGAVVAVLGAHGALTVDVGSFLLSAVILRVTVAARRAPTGGAGLNRWALITSGTRSVLGDRLLRRVIGVTAASFGTIIATEGLAVSYAHEIGRGDVATGILTAAVPVGSAVGLMLVGRISAGRRLPWLRVLAVLWPLPLLVTALRPPLALTAVLWALAGGLAAFQLLGNVLFAQAVSGEMRGRAFAFAQSSLLAVQGLGLALAGVVADVASPSLAVAVSGLAGLVSCGFLVLRLRPPQPSSTDTSEVVDNSRGRGVNHGGLLSRGHATAVTHVLMTGARRSRTEAGSAADSVGRRRATVVAVSVVVLLISTYLVARAPIHDLDPRRLHTSWWCLALLFAASEVLNISFQRGREVFSISATQIPRIAALFFATPLALLQGVAVATLVANLVRRIEPMKQIVNVAGIAAATAAAIYTFHQLATPGAGVGTHNLLAALAATYASDGVGFLFIVLVRRIFDPFTPVGAFLRPAAFVTVSSVAVGLLGLIAVAALYANASSAAFLLVIGVITASGLRAYANLQERHLNLGRLYTFQETLGALTPRGASLFPVLENARGLLLAESLTLYLQESVGSRAIHELRVHVDDAPIERRRSSLPQGSEQGGSAMKVELRVGDRPLGVLIARDRLGVVQKFGRSDLSLLKTLGAQVSDALERGTLLEQLQLAATHDSLTGLLTLGEFLRRVDERVIQGARMHLLLLDVAGLHEVNDSLGHEAGDALLVTLGERLQAVAPDGALLARSGGGEFAVALPADQTRAVRQIERISRTGNDLVEVLGVTVELRTRVGWLSLPRDASDSATALRRADLALASAKRDGRTTLRYSSGMDVDGFRRLRLVSDLRDAIGTGQLRCVYQPLVTASDGRVVGAEALVRWRHPEYGELSPDEFIPLAEHTGLIGEITETVLDLALAQVRRWHATGRMLRVAVNVSPRSLSDMSLPSMVVEMLTRHRVDPGYLTLEVTETSVAEDPVRALAVLEQLRSTGVRLSIDDFGTGYSTLAALKRFPVQEVKLDRQFLAEFDTDGAAKTSLALLEAVVSLGHTLELEIVAEGVESRQVYNTLRRLGVDVLQGYYLGKPLAADELPERAPRGALRAVSAHG